MELGQRLVLVDFASKARARRGDGPGGAEDPNAPITGELAKLQIALAGCRRFEGIPAHWLPE